MKTIVLLTFLLPFISNGQGGRTQHITMDPVEVVIDRGGNDSKRNEDRNKTPEQLAAKIEEEKKSAINRYVSDYIAKYTGYMKEMIAQNTLSNPENVSIEKPTLANKMGIALTAYSIYTIVDDVTKDKPISATATAICVSIGFAPPPYGFTGSIICELIKVPLVTIYEK